MPFDLLPEREAEDIIRLRVARDGVGAGWNTGNLGLEEDQKHCAIGWLLVATDWNEAEATQLALDYVWPALPPAAQAKCQSKIEAIYKYNDSADRKRVLTLFNDALRLAEKANARP
jgi:hypothetical protein